MTALLGSAVVMLLLGLMIPAPAGQLACYVVAGLLAVGPALRARGGRRLAGLVLLLAAVALGVYGYPAFRAEMDGYRQHAGERPAGLP